jgi:hypothetical protein
MFKIEFPSKYDGLKYVPKGFEMPSSTHKRRIVVGDIHGELDGLKEILIHAGLIDNHDTWSGGDSMWIQTGDVID